MLSRVLPVLFLLIFLPHVARSGQVELVSLDWAPYVGSELPEQGRVTAYVRSVLAAAGLQLHVSFVPWKRVLHDVRSDRAIGYFPEYRSVHREREFIYSRPIGCSAVGLVYRMDRPIHWEQVRDLGRYAIGVVGGYVNASEFDRLVNTGDIRPVFCRDDRTALRMLAQRRLDAVVMDREVFLGLQKMNNAAEDIASLVFHDRLLAEQTLHVCFRRNPEGRRLADMFERAAEHVVAPAVQCAP